MDNQYGALSWEGTKDIPGWMSLESFGGIHGVRWMETGSWGIEVGIMYSVSSPLE